MCISVSDNNPNCSVIWAYRIVYVRTIDVRWGVIEFPLRKLSAGAKAKRSILLHLHSLYSGVLLYEKRFWASAEDRVINLSQWKHPDFAIVDVEASWIMCRQAVPYKTTVIKTGLNYRSVNCYSFCLVRVTADGRKVPIKHTPFLDELSTCSAHERL